MGLRKSPVVLTFPIQDLRPSDFSSPRVLSGSSLRPFNRPRGEDTDNFAAGSLAAERRSTDRSSERRRRKNRFIF